MLRIDHNLKCIQSLSQSNRPGALIPPSSWLNWTCHMMFGMLFVWIILTTDSDAVNNLEILNDSLIVRLMSVNILLAVFNMLPLPPLDGGKVAVGMLPHRQAMKLESLERFGFFIVLGIFFVLPSLFRRAGIDVPIVEWLIWMPSSVMTNLLFYITGHPL